MDIISHLFVYWIEFPQSATKLLKSRDNSLNMGGLLRPLINSKFHSSVLIWWLHRAMESLSEFFPLLHKPFFNRLVIDMQFQTVVSISHNLNRRIVKLEFPPVFGREYMSVKSMFIVLFSARLSPTCL